MAELTRKRKGRVGTIPVSLPGQRVVQAIDLNDVLRDVITELREHNGWSWAETARQLGLAEVTLGDFMMESAKTPTGKKRGNGLSVATLSKIVAACGGNNPILLFQRHPLFSAGDREPESYAGLRSRLTPEQAEDLNQIIDVLLGRQDIDEFLRGMAATVGVDPKNPRPSPKRRKRSA